ncbi:MAG: histidine--tRNA ligase [Patescibacteria group bacterium]|nr:histidine--tRNA ligase [Patescibacteria group bacterium]
MADFQKQLLQSPSGFPELGPAEAIELRRMLEIIRKHFELAGYVPIETSLVERSEVLFAKSEGEIRNQVYGLRLLNPTPGAPTDEKDLALRYDQTMPLARFVAANQGSLVFPFRRYVIGPVFRGERPKDGRYRQFTQADIDVIGDGNLSVLHDAEMVAIIAGIFTELAIGPFTIRIGHRKILQGLFQSVGIEKEELVAHALRIVDRLEKDGLARTREALESIGVNTSAIDTLLKLFTEERPTDETLEHLSQMEGNEVFRAGVSDLREVVAAVRDLKVPEKRFRVDVSIARGLDYYTGTVYETRFDDHPNIGSIASGGRFENLASVFTNRKLPGVGISIGVTRLLLRLIKAGLLPAKATTLSSVLVTTPEIAEYRASYLAYAASLRAAGIPAEIYLESRPLNKQMSFANRRGFRIVVIATHEHMRTNMVVVRNLLTGDQQEVMEDRLIETVRSMLDEKS